MTRIFISYRREDSADVTGRIYDRLVSRFGRGNVFKDVDSIISGKDFTEEMRKAVNKSDVFLTIIGVRWLSVADKDGGRRIDNPDDYVRIEVDAALKRDMQVIPVLVRGASMPSEAELPEPIKLLARRQAPQVRSDPDFDHDMGRLIADIVEYSDHGNDSSSPAEHKYLRSQDRAAGVEPPHSAPPSSARTCEFQISPTRLNHGADHLVGREDELAILDRAWRDPSIPLLTVLAWGGVGKTSLVVEWMARQAKAGWPGFERVFDWSFYSQGTREQGTTSADGFIAAALEFFGDREMANSAASPWDKGARLAHLVAQRPSLLVLDGLEPLQHPPGPLAGQLRDPALKALVRGLAQHNTGLCLVTTRERVADLATYRDTTAQVLDLQRLSVPAGIELLKFLGVRSTNEVAFGKLVEDVDGHALTLNLLGRYLAKAHGGDINRRDRVKFETADAKIQGGHAFKTMAAYEEWFAGGGEDGARQLAVLRLLGIFGHPADPGCLAELCRTPVIAGLTDMLVDLPEEDWNSAVDDLKSIGLLKTSPWEPRVIRGFGPDGAKIPAPVRGEPQTFLCPPLPALDSPFRLSSSLDTHPLIRQYFAARLMPDALKEGHRRLYGYLRDVVPHWPESLAGLQPLYEAVTHACAAGLRQDAFRDVFYSRILRGHQFFSVMRLGAVQSDLNTLGTYFGRAWEPTTLQGVTGQDKAVLLKHVGYCLRASARSKEAIKVLKAASDEYRSLHNFSEAISTQGLQCFAEIIMGNLADALATAKDAVNLARETNEQWVRAVALSRLAEVKTYMGDYPAADDGFRHGFEKACGRQPKFNQFGQHFRNLEDNKARAGMVGFLCRYCDFLVSSGKCQDAIEWTTTLVLCMTGDNWRFDSELHSGLARLFLGQANLGMARHGHDTLGEAQPNLQSALAHFRKGSREHEFCRVWISLTELIRVQVEQNPDSLNPGKQERLAQARDYLNSAWQIAIAGAMLLFMADIHLLRARLFFREKPYPWKSPQDDLAAAEKLINDCGYHRRDADLADAKRAILEA